MLGIGSDAFKAMLAGAHEMDRHFHTQPTAQNIPVMMVLLGIGTVDISMRPPMRYCPTTKGRRFPAFLQQEKWSRMANPLTSLVSR